MFGKFKLLVVGIFICEAASCACSFNPDSLINLLTSSIPSAVFCPISTKPPIRIAFSTASITSPTAVLSVLDNILTILGLANKVL